MAHQVIWTKLIMEHFIENANLTPVEEHILRLRCAGKTRTEISMLLHLSVATVDRAVARLKKKYDIVQQYDPILPPRKFSAQELYMDTH